MFYKNFSPRLFNYSLIAICTLIWGSSYMIIKKCLLVFSPDQVAALRLSVSGLVLVAFTFPLIMRIAKKDWKFIFMVAMFGNGIPAFLFTAAQMHISSSLTGMLNTLTPLAVAVVGALLFKTAIQKNQIVGILLGLFGAVVLIAFGGNVAAGEDNRYGLLVVLSSCLYGISTNTISDKLSHLSALPLLGGSFLIAGIPAGIYLFTTDFFHVLQTSENAMFGMKLIMILVLLNTVLGNILFVKAIQNLGAVRASVVSYLMPIVSLMWGYWDGESLNWVHFAGIGLIFLGVVLVQKKAFINNG